MNLIKVLTFNVLAPSWATPNSYPSSTCPTGVPNTGYLNAEYRRQKIIGLLNAVKSKVDVICLQETQIDEFPYFASALGSGWKSYQTFHNDDYWSSYITANPPFARNGTGILLKKQSFSNINFMDIPLSDDGNHATLATCIHSQSGKTVRIVSCHLDSDTGGRRNKEAKALMDIMQPDEDILDIVAGDFNANCTEGVLNNIFSKARMDSVLDILGITEQTHPFCLNYNSNNLWGIIDHVMVRNGSAYNSVPVDVSGNPATVTTGVLDYGVWVIYPAGNDPTIDANRINRTLENCGSDHFPVVATIKL